MSFDGSSLGRASHLTSALAHLLQLRVLVCPYHDGLGAYLEMDAMALVAFEWEPVRLGEKVAELLKLLLWEVVAGDGEGLY